MTEQLLQRRQAPSRLQPAAGERVPQLVDVEVLELRQPLDRPREMPARGDRERDQLADPAAQFLAQVRRQRDPALSGAA